MSEFERNRLLKMQQLEPLEQQAIEIAPPVLNPAPAISFSPPTASPEALSIVQVKLKLLEQLTQELRTPLTSILGMANVVGREIYGPLTTKQKEYLEIIQNSGRYLLSLVNEVSQLGVVEEYSLGLNLTTVDIEMLCQQILNTLDEVAKRKEQKLRLSLEPAKSRMWVLDKDKVRQLIYHLISSMIQAATSGSAIRIHISYKSNSTLDRGGQSNLLNLAISVSHPWLGEGLTPVDPYLGQISAFHGSRTGDERQESKSKKSMHEHDDRGEDKTELVNVNSFNRSCESLRLLLSRALAELHGGQIDILGTPESGYRYVVSLPELTLAQANAEI
jgi:signal transduction histidine kinase